MKQKTERPYLEGPLSYFRFNRAEVCVGEAVSHRTDSSYGSRFYFRCNYLLSSHLCRKTKNSNQSERGLCGVIGEREANSRLSLCELFGRIFCSIFGINGEACRSERPHIVPGKAAGDLTRDQHEKVLKTRHKAVIWRITFQEWFSRNVSPSTWESGKA